MGTKVFISCVFSDNPTPNDADHPDVIAVEMEIPDDMPNYLFFQAILLPLTFDNLIDFAGSTETQITLRSGNLNEFTKGVIINTLSDLTPESPLLTSPDDGSDPNVGF